MNERRHFMKEMTAIFAAMSLPFNFDSAIALNESLNVSNMSGGSPNDEDYWNNIRTHFVISPSMINLNNGGVSPQPIHVQDAADRYYRMANEAPSYYMWRVIDAGREPLRENLAKLAGCKPNEIAINRNSTEGLNSIIFGLNLKKGDEVILTKQDYPNMINAWKQREKRDGIVLKWVNLELPTTDNKYIVEQYTSQITDKTKIIHITHIINWSGQILPVKEISRIAHSKNVEVLVDGAHSFAHIDYNIPDLECDYFATSLHKWMCAPFGSGLMYIKEDKIKNVWALLSSNEPDGDDIRKFESLGTRNMGSEMAIGTALDYHNMITTKRKQARLHHIKEYWTSKLLDNKKVKFNTPLHSDFSGAICNFRIEGKTPEEISNELQSKYKIHTVAINWENINGVRVTPHIYTAKYELDKLANAINEISMKS